MVTFTQIPDLPTNLTWIDSCCNADASLLFTLGTDLTNNTVILYRRKNNIWEISYPATAANSDILGQIVCDNTGLFVIYSTSANIYISHDGGNTFILSNLPVTSDNIIGITLGGTSNVGFNIYATIVYNT